MFPLHFRVPGWCNNPIVKINDQTIPISQKGGEIIKISRLWKNNDKISIEFPMEVFISHWYDNGAVVERATDLRVENVGKLAEKGNN